MGGIGNSRGAPLMIKYEIGRRGLVMVVEMAMTR